MQSNDLKYPIRIMSISAALPHIGLPQACHQGFTVEREPSFTQVVDQVNREGVSRGRE